MNVGTSMEMWCSFNINGPLDFTIMMPVFAMKGIMLLVRLQHTVKRYLPIHPFDYSESTKMQRLQMTWFFALLNHTTNGVEYVDL